MRSTICISNCAKQSIKLYFTQVTENGLQTERTYLESGDIYASQDGFLDLTKEVRMFVSILENPEIRFIIHINEPKKEICDVCYKDNVEAREK